MNLTEAQRRALRMIARSPRAPLLTQHRQRCAAGLYALGLLKWSRDGYELTIDGTAWLADHGYDVAAPKQGRSK